MRILFYSTNSNYFDGTKFYYKSFPLNKTTIEEFCRQVPEHEFIFATQLPGMFMLDLEGNEAKQKAECAQYALLQKDDPLELAQEIASYKPDAVIAATFWTTPYDWLPVKDALVAEQLNSLGIKTYCHSTETAVNCFDKWRTHQAVEKLNVIEMPKAVYVHHALFINGGNRRELKSNVYRQSVLQQIKSLRFPVVIKDTVGLSSYGMDVIHSYQDVLVYLNSKRNTSDRIVEEYIQGIQFGAEIYGTTGATSCGYEKDITRANNSCGLQTDTAGATADSYYISPVFMFSVNKYGITSPKQSVKLGPVNSEKFHISELREQLKHLAQKMHFEGAAQVDLVYSEQNAKWYLIEINPRLSGMSQTVAASVNKNIFTLLLENTLFAESARVSTTDTSCTKQQPVCSTGTSCTEQQPVCSTDTSFAKQQPVCSTAASAAKYVFDFKLPLLTEEQFESVKKFPSLKYICQTENLAARQLREQGFCEIIFGTTDSLGELEQNLEQLKKDYPDLIEPVFFENAVSMISLIK